MLVWRGISLNMKFRLNIFFPFRGMFIAGLAKIWVLVESGVEFLNFYGGRGVQFTPANFRFRKGFLTKLTIYDFFSKKSF